MDARYRQFDVLDDNGLTLYLISRYPQPRNRPLAHRVVSNDKPAPYFRTIKEVADAWKTANEEMLDLVRSQWKPQHSVRCWSTSGTVSTRVTSSTLSLMVRLAVGALRADHVGALEAISRLEHLMVDEYQDVNTVQEALIRELHGRSSTLFVVGDDDQAIYGWRGADVDNIISFERRYAGCSVHTLPHNFRSTRAIVESADTFAHQNWARSASPKTPPQAIRPGRETSEFCGSTRAKRRASGSRRDRGTDRHALRRTRRRPSRADARGRRDLMRSVRSRSNGIARHQAFADALVARGIPFTLEAGGGLFDRPQVEVLRGTFELLRAGSPGRSAARAHFEELVAPLFPNASFDRFASVLADLGEEDPRTAWRHAPAPDPQALVTNFSTLSESARRTFPRRSCSTSGCSAASCRMSNRYT